MIHVFHRYAGCLFSRHQTFLRNVNKTLCIFSTRLSFLRNIISLAFSSNSALLLSCRKIILLCSGSYINFRNLLQGNYRSIELNSLFLFNADFKNCTAAIIIISNQCQMNFITGFPYYSSGFNLLPGEAAICFFQVNHPVGAEGCVFQLF